MGSRIIGLIRRIGFAGASVALGVGTMAVADLALTPSRAMAADTAAAALDLSQYRGKVVYVDFWASWCAPCRLSFAYLNQLRQSYSNRDLVIITVNVDRDKAAAGNFLRAVGGQLPVVYDPKGAIATHFGVATMPTSVLIGRDGRQRFVHRGYFDNKTGEYSQHVAALVDEHN